LNEYSTRAIDLVRRSRVVDMLGLLAVNDDILNRWVSGPEGMTPDEIDTFKTSGISTIHMSVGVGGPTSYEDSLHYMAMCNGFIARHSDHFARIDRVHDMDRANSSGKVGIILGLQNAEQFRTPNDVRMFYGLGLRCAQLTYNEHNRLGSGATDRADGGVSDFGVEIIKQMNDVGMLVDVSHCGDRTTLDAIELSARPIAITHANCRALNDHPRLKTDEAIRKLAAKGGVMGITGVRMFVRGEEPTTIEHLVDHIDHVAKLTGIEHVGIGSDCDLWGYDALPEKMRQE
jgi:membrane dipeptidase